MKLLYKYRFVFISLIISLIFLYPYLVGPLNYEHDTLFHLSRIEGLAKAFSHQDFIPSIYFDKNMLYGYGSPLFYSDFFLIPFSFLYLLGLPLVITYKLVLFVFTFIGCLFLVKLLRLFTSKDGAIILGLALFTFALYRLTNVYVRGALGEVMAYSFLPLALLGIFNLFRQRRYLILALSFSALLLTHNITFFIVCLVFGLLLIMNYKIVLNDKLYWPILKAVGLALGLCCFMWLPMLEQLQTQSFYLGQSNNSGLMNNSSLHIYQYFLNRLNFSTSAQSFTGMVTTPGILLLLLPLTSCFLLDRKCIKHHQFIKQCMWIGYGLMLIQSSAFRLGDVGLFNIMQFSWRFTNVACILLLIPSVVYTSHLIKSHFSLLAIVGCCVINGSFLSLKVLERINVLPNDVEYESIIDGSLIDPFYGESFFVRIELAAADYLPSNSISYKDRPYGIFNQQSTDLLALPNVDYERLSFTLEAPNSVIVLPKTYYKGYQVYQENIALNTFSDPYTGLVAFETDTTSGNYTLVYEKTFLQLLSLITSGFTILFLGGYLWTKKNHHI